MSDAVPRLIAEDNPRVPRELALFHYLRTPPIGTEAEYRHYLHETARLVRSLKADDPPEVVASVWAVADRALDYTSGQRPNDVGIVDARLH